MSTQSPPDAANSDTSKSTDAGPDKKYLESQEEYIWRFDVDARLKERGYEDPLVEMVRLFLDDFLNLGFLTCEGEPVRVTGFAFNNNPKHLYDIFLDEHTSGGEPPGKLSPGASA